MTSRKSKTRSDTTSRSKPHKRRVDPAFRFPPIYIDESASQVALPAALRAHGFVVWTRYEVYPDDPQVNDPTWLRYCGRQGWVAITKDKAIRHRPGELDMVRRAGVRMFTISSGSLPAVDQVATVLQAIPAMRRVVHTTRPPFIARIMAGGRVEIIVDR